MLMLTCKHKSNHYPHCLYCLVGVFIQLPNTKRRKKFRHELRPEFAILFSPIRTDLHYNHVCTAVLSSKFGEDSFWYDF